MRSAFVSFGRDYQASGRFGVCLDLLKERLADPVGDRVVEAFRVAREVGVETWGACSGRCRASCATLPGPVRSSRRVPSLALSRAPSARLSRVPGCCRSITSRNGN